MDRWDLIKKSDNIVVNESFSHDEALITDEEQTLIPLIAKILQERSLRYYIVRDSYERDENGEAVVKPRHSLDYYMATAGLIYEAAKRLSEAPGGRGYGSHSLKTWIAVIMGPDAEPHLLEI